MARRVKRSSPASAGVEADHLAGHHFGRLAQTLRPRDRERLIADAFRLDDWQDRLALAEQRVGEVRSSRVVDVVRARLRKTGMYGGAEAQQRELDHFNRGVFTSAHDIWWRPPPSHNIDDRLPVLMGSSFDPTL